MTSPVAQDGLEAEHLVAGHAVLHGPHAAGVGGDVAPEAGAVLAREHRVDEPVHGRGGVELVEGDAGLDDRNFYDRSYFNAHDRTGDIFLDHRPRRTTPTSA